MKFIQVDAFTNKPFTGNPAVVCILQKSASKSWMQQVASEMNLSETAFLWKQVNNTYNLRWFTPTVEVNLCGHATLASAHVLFEKEYESPDKVILFETRSGLLTARRNGDWIEMDFPLDRSKPIVLPEKLQEALDCPIQNIEKTALGHLIVEIDSETTLKKLNPNFRLLQRIDSPLVIVTSTVSGKWYHYATRVFAPQMGILEDPVTGSAHCALSAYWGVRLKQNKLTAFQASERGGTIKTELTQNERVILSGQSITVLEGTILFPEAGEKLLSLASSATS